MTNQDPFTYPLPEGLEWHTDLSFVSAYSKKESWHYGWTWTRDMGRTAHNDAMNLYDTYVENKAGHKLHIGKFDTLEEGMRYLSNFLILGGLDG